RNAPGKGGAGYGQVAQTLLDKGDDLVALALGLDEIRMGVDVCQKLLLVLAHAEEIGFLLELFHRTVAIGAASFNQLGLGPEGFAGGTVPVLIFTQIDVALIEDVLEDVSDTLLVAFLCRADKVVV